MKETYNPAIQAVALGVSVFVGVTSVFVAAMAFGIARLVEEPGLSRMMGGLALINCYLALRFGRKSPWTAVVLSAVFAVVVAVLLWQFSAIS